MINLPFPRLRFQLQRDRWNKFSRFCFLIQFGYRPPPWNMGAGYKGGATFFFAYNCRNRQGGNIYLNRRFQLGITRNWNRVPYASS